MATPSTGPSSEATSPASGSSGSDPLASTSDVPVGGGTILADKQIVLTQPVKGEFKGFSAVCTHQQCLVTTVSDGLIGCPCHGSAFSITNGSVVAGPAPSPLPAVKVTVQGGEIVKG